MFLVPFTVTVQVVLPVQSSPLQPEKTKPAEGVAVRVTIAPLAKLALQLPVQFVMPDGVLETVPP